MTLLLPFAHACKRTPAQLPAAKAETPEEARDTLPDSVRLTSAAIAEARIETWKVEPVALEHLLVVPGNVEHDANRHVVLSSSVRGRVASIPVDLGQPVKKGQPIVWLESMELGKAREEYAKAVAEFRAAEKSYERARRLVAEKAISAGEFNQREADYFSRHAAVSAAAGALRQAGDSPPDVGSAQAANPPSGGIARVAVRAPFDGNLIDRKATPGSLVEALAPLATFADLRSLWVFFQVYEKDLALLRAGLPVKIVTEAYPEEIFPGKVDFIGAEVDEATRTVRVRAIVRNSQEKLKPGMFVKGRIEVPKPAREAPGVLAVPQSALQTLEGRTTVFIRTAPDTFARRFVETGHTFEGFTEVLSGIRQGEVVVTEGSFVLKSEFAKASLATED
jgi:cobalt-zinc-cadmium efflux system membrane fusion protein